AARAARGRASACAGVFGAPRRLPVAARGGLRARGAREQRGHRAPLSAADASVPDRRRRERRARAARAGPPRALSAAAALRVVRGRDRSQPSASPRVFQRARGRPFAGLPVARRLECRLGSGPDPAEALHGGAAPAERQAVVLRHRAARGLRDPPRAAAEHDAPVPRAPVAVGAPRRRGGDQRDQPAGRLPAAPGAAADGALQGAAADRARGPLAVRVSSGVRLAAAARAGAGAGLARRRAGGLSRGAAARPERRHRARVPRAGGGPALSYRSVTAPRLLEATWRAYFASTPRV